mmetsp:Transcript_8549/g.17836  ORF Transcript_8549/g.17836 Transcript_8549/m.17836 type:complete len:340 (+) Transcript_8549:45-1064(+)|eukprot:CAMPEP_0201201860 /NCGR_PEP_ID=MMETSP0851-20130426/163762_1 /ASSEMBLY_ACC=CAM_ASM_000631 /TAXON_ID=183588 /ORGANISM="Pseudo-nitzschia fraudulenta, Strain WWA7" /LENGTH=339 /DNA_ID=CAMNT_0047489607 /DNA_START=160 /DNA_END=1179 /DNA_ORIENTATION=+
MKVQAYSRKKNNFVRSFNLFVLCVGLKDCVCALSAPGIASGENANDILVNKFARSRRTFVSRACGSFGAASLWAFSSPMAHAAQTKKGISNRLNEVIISLPPPSLSSELNGVDNMYFPSYLSGEWKVTQTLVDMQAPLGMKYIGGPNGSLEIAEKTMKEAQSKLDIPVNFKLRYVDTMWGVAEDRLYNNQERLNAFAQKSVVASVEYADVGGSNRKSVIVRGGTKEDPLQTTIVYFKGPFAQKNFITSHGAEKESETTWTGYEVQRSIFALTNQNTSPPITTDSEYIWSFELLDENHVRGSLRIAGYLNAQSDTLYFDARNRAVSIQDYVLDMRKSLKK